MEEILASIRKIIADDEALPLSGRLASPPRLFETNVTPLAAPERSPEEPAARAVEAPEPAADPIEPELEELPPAEATLATPAQVERDDAAICVEEDERDATVEDAAPEVAIAADGPSVGEPLSGQAAPGAGAPSEEFVIRSALQSEPEALAESEADDRGVVDPAMILSPEANASVASAFQALSASVQFANSEMIERHVREMLRPMLKQWLDDNLPVMVERLVRTEIERVARGGR